MTVCLLGCNFSPPDAFGAHKSEITVALFPEQHILSLTEKCFHHRWSLMKILKKLIKHFYLLLMNITLTSQYIYVFFIYINLCLNYYIACLKSEINLKKILHIFQNKYTI